MESKPTALFIDFIEGGPIDISPARLPLQTETTTFNSSRNINETQSAARRVNTPPVLTSFPVTALEDTASSTTGSPATGPYQSNSSGQHPLDLTGSIDQSANQSATRPTAPTSASQVTSSLPSPKRPRGRPPKNTKRGRPPSVREDHLAAPQPAIEPFGPVPRARVGRPPGTRSIGRPRSAIRRDNKCALCLKTFSQKTALEVHIRAVHKREKPFMCPTCGKCFAQKGNMLTHQKRHCPLVKGQTPIPKLKLQVTSGGLAPRPVGRVSWGNVRVSYMESGSSSLAEVPASSLASHSLANSADYESDSDSDGHGNGRESSADLATAGEAQNRRLAPPPFSFTTAENSNNEPIQSCIEEISGEQQFCNAGKHVGQPHISAVSTSPSNAPSASAPSPRRRAGIKMKLRPKRSERLALQFESSSNNSSLSNESDQIFIQTIEDEQEQEELRRASESGASNDGHSDRASSNKDNNYYITTEPPSPRKFYDVSSKSSATNSTSFDDRSYTSAKRIIATNSSSSGGASSVAIAPGNTSTQAINNNSSNGHKNTSASKSYPPSFDISSRLIKAANAAQSSVAAIQNTELRRHLQGSSSSIVDSPSNQVSTAIGPPMVLPQTTRAPIPGSAAAAVVQQQQKHQHQPQHQPQESHTVSAPLEKGSIEADRPNIDHEDPVTETRSSMGTAVPLFNWDIYLQLAPGSIVAPPQAFQQSSQKLRNDFMPEMKLEARDPRKHSSWGLAKVVAVYGPRIKLRFDGVDKSNDFWELVDSGNIRPVGAGGDEPLLPPMGYTFSLSSYPKFVEKQLAKSLIAPPQLFQPEPKQPERNMFEAGMKLEAVDRKNPHMICPATVASVEGDEIKIAFDGWSGSFDYRCKYYSRDIFPVKWCEKNNHLVSPIKDWAELVTNSGELARAAAPAGTDSAPAMPRPIIRPMPASAKARVKQTQKRRTASLPSDKSEMPRSLHNDGLHTGSDIKREKNKSDSVNNKGKSAKRSLDKELAQCEAELPLDDILEDDEPLPPGVDKFQCRRAMTHQEWIREKGNLHNQNGDQIYEEDDDSTQPIPSPTPVDTQNESSPDPTTNEPRTGSQYAAIDDEDHVNKKPKFEISLKNFAKWKVHHVLDLMRSDDILAKYCDLFERNEIDGKAFLLLTADIMVNHMGLGWGPALHILDTIKKANLLNGNN